jgi:pimeloyl-ACP methyl ester carboxylesterase
VNAHRLAVLMPAAKVELFDDAGHLFWCEDPERAAALLAALRRGG